MSITRKTLSDLVTATLRNHGSTLADSLKDNALLKRYTNAYEWISIWRQAINNMPWIGADGCREFEKIAALAKCLGVRQKHVRRGLIEGHEPKKAQYAAQVRQYAGGYGTQLAAIRLANLGVLSEYPHWPPS